MRIFQARFTMALLVSIAHGFIGAFRDDFKMARGGETFRRKGKTDTFLSSQPWSLTIS